jgi:hypothetical protein
MLKNTSFSALILLVGGALAFFNLPWWSITLAAALGSFLFPLPPMRAAAIAFGLGFSLWWGVAFFFHTQNAGLLTAKIGELFANLSAPQLLSLTGGIGGVLAALGALCGVYFKQLLRPATA